MAIFGRAVQDDDKDKYVYLPGQDEGAPGMETLPAGAPPIFGSAVAPVYTGETEGPQGKFAAATSKVEGQWQSERDAKEEAAKKAEEPAPPVTPDKPFGTVPGTEAATPVAGGVFGSALPPTTAPQRPLYTGTTRGPEAHQAIATQNAELAKDKAVVEQDKRKAIEARDPVGLHYAQVAEQEIAKRGQWGQPESKHPGIFGKIMHGLATAGNIAGDVLAPGVMMNIPGTELNREVTTQARERQEQGVLAEGTKTDLEKAQAAVAGQKAATDKYDYKDVQDTRRNLPDGSVNPNYGKTVIAGVNKSDPNDVQFTGQLAAGLPKSPAETREAHLNTYANLNRRLADGEQLSPEEEAQRKTLEEQFSVGKKSASDTNARILAELQSNPTLAAKYKTLPAEFHVYPTDTAADAKDKMQAAKDLAAAGTKQQQIVIQGQQHEETATRREIAKHDADYVKPANQVEQSYEKMDSAYREFETAIEAGQTLPTGAQSMLALSTHLGTTFGTVKGSKITKDMIQEHLHARSISDDVAVAINKLRDGDQLSPAQWTAFHDLVSQSRRYSWETAVREAYRKGIPIDFLPEDITAVRSGKHASIIPTSQKARYHKDNPDAEFLD